MSSKPASSTLRRPPAVAVSGHAAAPVHSRPIKLSSAVTPAKTKKKTTTAGAASLPGSAKKSSAGTTPLRSSPLPKNITGSGRGKLSARTSAARPSSLPSSRNPSLPSTGAPPAGNTTTVTATTTTASTRATTTAAAAAAAAAPRQSQLAHPFSGSTLHHAGSGTNVAQATPPAASLSPPPATELAASSVGAAHSSKPSASPAPAYPRGLSGRHTLDSPTATHLTASALGGASGSGAAPAPTTISTSVAAASSAVAGERYEPTEYKTQFTLGGTYSCAEAVPQTASIWMGNRATGAIDVFSSTTGKLTVTLPARGEREALSSVGRQSARSSISGKGRVGLQSIVFPSTSPTVSPQRADGLAGSTRRGDPPPCAVAMRASRSHMWVGYEDGSVAVYDHLVLTFTTEGRFHSAPVVKLCLLDSDTVVSVAEDGTVVHWDREEKNFEAIARLPSLARSVSDGLLTAATAVPKGNTVVCGFSSGVMYAVDVATAARQVSQAGGHYERSSLALHDGRINELVVVGDILFSASEDGSVSATQLCVSDAARATSSGGFTTNYTLTSRAEASKDVRQEVSWRLLKRIRTVPSVRGFLAETHTQSLYVAYSDGLVERWSSNPNDDFGVEEVIREGMRSGGNDDGEGTGGASGTPSLVDRQGRKTPSRASLALSDSRSAGSSRAGAAPRAQDTKKEVTGLFAINAVETLQVLALSSNGVNKVWYGHRNVLEENISSSINTLNAVIREDAHDTAVWRERMSLLRVKETERKGKYVLILEQLSEQRLLLKYYEMWRRRVIRESTGKSREALAVTLAQRCDYRLQANYFTRWASFYDLQQRQFRRYTLCRALAEATQRTYISSVLHRWRMNLLLRREKQSTETCVDVLARASQALVAAPAYFRWLRFARDRVQRQQHVDALQQPVGLNHSPLVEMERKAQRQVLRRALAHWLDVADYRRRKDGSHAACAQYVELYSQVLQAKQAKSLFQGWRRWAARRHLFASLEAVAVLRSHQRTLHVQLDFLLRWQSFLHQKHLDAHAAEIQQIESKLKAAETDAGGDIFEKLQLQKRIDVLIQQQDKEAWQLTRDKARLRALQTSRDDAVAEHSEGIPWAAKSSSPELQQSQQQPLADDGGETGGVSVHVSSETIAALPTTAASALGPPLTPGSTATLGIGGASGAGSIRGPMTAHANFFRHLVEQQHLSPSVLMHMPLPEAVYHVMSQLKGNVLNMYTDMGLFRQVKDRRRAGVSAVAIFLESFAEVKRLVVTSVRRGGNAKADARVSRWPLSMEALDSVPSHHCSTVLIAIKTMVIAYDLISTEELDTISATCETVVANADWVFLIARACHARRKPLLPVNNRV